MAQNSLDSTFCKKCGTTLPDDDLRNAREKLEQAVADGFRIFNAGRTDEAMHIAETAVRANPASTAALSLKAMCHERLGQISEALDCHEKVLEIDPDSMIDKIKVNDLRNLLVARTSAASVPDRRTAIISSVAAFILIVSIGVVLARGGTAKGDSKVATNLPATNSQQEVAKGSRFDSPIAPVGNQAQPGNKPNPPAANPGTSGNSTNPGVDSTRGGGDSPVRLPDPGANGRALPNPSNGPTDFGSGFGPVTINPGSIPPGSDQNHAPAKKENTESSGDPPPSDNPPQPQTPPKREAPGIMDIRIVSGNGASPGDPNDPGSHANGVEALLRTARSQYQIGNFTAAATSYERALRAGADPASGNQRLAQCYEKLGRNSDAVSAYGRAIDALQSAIASGRGDKDRLGAALDSCKQAVKVLGG
ncbi:MAG TPA: tetratricopeptide repeat protein [Fimbriimonadaceae bacterium]|nr:tetratricopeptide repeat protein [Fimbriimonadaceae bacterium]